MAVPVYSSNQEDGKPSEDKYIDKLRQDLKKYALDKNGEVAAIRKFTGDDAEYEAKVQRGEVPPVQFLIVCNKLLTGFDAPRESVMYLDSPLKEHNLLQAIARTNRVYGSHKEFGLIHRLHRRHQPPHRSAVNLSASGREKRHERLGGGTRQTQRRPRRGNEMPQTHPPQHRKHPPGIRHPHPAFRH